MFLPYLKRYLSFWLPCFTLAEFWEGVFFSPSFSEKLGDLLTFFCLLAHLLFLPLQPLIKSSWPLGVLIPYIASHTLCPLVIRNELISLTPSLKETLECFFVKINIKLPRLSLYQIGEYKTQHSCTWESLKSNFRCIIPQWLKLWRKTFMSSYDNEYIFFIHWIFITDRLTHCFKRTWTEGFFLHLSLEF